MSALSNVLIQIVRSASVNMALAVPITQRLVRRRHYTGIDGDLEKARELFEYFDEREPVQDRDVVELGPGKTLETLQLAHEAGARRVVAIDVTRYHSDETANEMGIEYLIFDGHELPLTDASVDVVWAHYCMQHFREPEQMLHEVRRVLRPGGALLCRVDLRDHYHMFEPGHEYECLRYNERMWRAMASNRSSYVNRLRFSEWLALLDYVGLVAETVTPHRDEEILRANRGNRYLRQLSDDDIATYRFDGTFRAPS